MRVITGIARGKRLETLEGMDTRPTGEKVKEALFSSIQFEIEGANVLDLFAGSGQLGIEALSRGAAKCTFIDDNRKCTEIIKQNLVSTALFDKSLVALMKGEDFLKHNKEKFDIIFLDPPYSKGIIKNIENDIRACASDSAIIVCETDKSEDMPEIFADCELSKCGRYSRTSLWIYRKQPKY